MDRRKFLKLSGVAATGVGLAACTHNAATREQAQDTTIKGKMAENFPGISLLGYGCMRWPMVEAEDGTSHIDQEAVNALVDEAIAHGVNYFDTAPVYLQGQSEKATSIALNRYPRSKWILATKASNFSNWSFENTVKMYHNSLEVFETDHIDYYLLHSVGSLANFNKRFGDTGLADYFASERDAGRIRNLGFSFHGGPKDMDDLLALHDKYHWDFIQIQMNYVDWEITDNAKYYYEQITERNIPVVIMEPLLGGGLADIPEVLATKLKSRDPKSSVASWAFRFAGSYPNVLTVLSGMTYMDHLQDNLRTYCDFRPVNDEEKELLFDIAKDFSEYSLIHCTDCKYCMPCPYGIDIPGIFAFYNKTVNEGTYVKTPEQEKYARTRRKYLAGYDKAVVSYRQADHCIACGQCLKACPQRIKIPTELKRIDDYIEKIKREEF